MGAKGISDPRSAIYASDPARSRGRLYPTDPSPTRTPFQRDRDRIIHSTAFRRLQYKTQVFLIHEGRHFRTRLTHTLEVAQIARSISRALGLNEDLAEALALAHDLGHPPFGHAGERVLARKMAQSGGFDHNFQAIRAVTTLENHYAAHDGLNLSWEVIEGLIKHNGPLDGEALPKVLEGPIAIADLQLTSFAGLEAQVAAIADDIAYDTHDIDDAIRAGILCLDDLADVPLVGAHLSQVRARYGGAPPARQAHELVRRLITAMIENVIATSADTLARINPQSADEVRRARRALIGFDPEMAQQEQGLKKVLFYGVYRHEKVMTHVRRAEEVIERLFDAYASGAPLPHQWQARAQSAENENGADTGANGDRFRVICDFLAGMTDPFALSEYERLFDDRPEFV